MELDYTIIYQFDGYDKVYTDGTVKHYDEDGGVLGESINEILLLL